MSEPLELSVVIPCLNEAKTISRVVEEALQGMAAAGLRGEVVVSDNGSTDGSQDLARAAGARVVDVPLKGYGAALHNGITHAAGRWVIFGDADLSYDFTLIPRFLDFIREQDPSKCRDLVLGTRLKGVIQPGAMPFLNRHLGTPVLNQVIRLFFGLATSDCNSGMRLVRKAFYETLPMRAPGMEWASELLIKTTIMGGRYAEVPIVLRPDQRGRPPHLRPWRDGWRHLKTIVLLSPNRLILVPSLVALLLGAASLAMGREQLGLLFSTVGEAGVALGLLVKLVLHMDGVRASRLVTQLVKRAFPEAVLALGLVCSAAGAAGVLLEMPGFPGPLLSTTGALLVLTSFAWGVLVTHCLHRLEGP